MLNFERMRRIFVETKVVRKPTYGIVTGYHELPYVCLGHSFAEGYHTTQVCGKVQVSPRFVLRPSDLEDKYADIFGEDNIDVELAGRVFGYLGFRGKPVECKSEDLQLQHLEISLEDMTDRVLDEMERKEDITTGLILTPDSRYFPVSLERFIASVLDDEFSL